jgi:fucose permease
MCLAVFFTWGSFNALETILTFYFQDVQLLNATEASLRFLPAPISGAVSNIVIGAIVHRVSANWLILGGCTLSAIGPLIMAFATPTSPYWSHAFLANLFNPIGADSLFTIANLLITSVFPSKTQALAGGVFNTISQIGKSVGLALVAVIAASVTAKSDYTNKQSPKALLEGYIATFWFCFGLILLTIAISLWGLRRVGNVGHKRD